MATLAVAAGSTLVDRKPALEGADAPGSERRKLISTGRGLVVGPSSSANRPDEAGAKVLSG